MSAQGVQKAAQALNAIGQLLPVIAEADAEGLDVAKLINGTLARSGIAAPDIVAAVVIMVQVP